MDPSVVALIDQMMADRKAAEKRLEADRRAAEDRQEATDRQIALLMQQLAQRVEPAQVSLHKELSGRMKEFVYDTEESSTFELWYARYETIFTTSAATMTDAQKVDLITEKLNYQDYLKFSNTIMPRTKATIPFVDAVKELKRIFGRKESQFAQRYKCLKVEMEENEDFDSYAARINLKCEKFDIAKCTVDDFKVLMFVQGLNKSQYALTLEKLLAKMDDQEKRQEEAADPAAVVKLKLQDVVNIATRIGYLKGEKSMVMNNTPPPAEVMAIQNKSSWRNKTSPGSGDKQVVSSGSKPKFPCRMCGEMHFHSDCPFIEKECFECKKLGHKAGYCTSAKWNRKSKPNDLSNHPRKSMTIQTHAISTRKYVEPSVDGRKLKLQLDSGSDWTIISKANWLSIGSPKLMQCEEQALSASLDPVPLLGKFNARIKLHGREAVGACYVSSSALNLLGSDWMENLDLWSVPIANVCNKVQASSLEQEVKLKFPQLFVEGLGKCTKFKASLALKEGSKAIFRKKRPVPFAAAKPIEEELKRLQLMNVISPIDYSEYAAPIVVVKKKSGQIRICGDYSTGLNDSLEPNKYPLPTPEEIFAKMSQFKVFSKIDLSDAFLQVEVDDEAKKMMAINTHCGMFQVNRLQPGIKTAPGMFQQLMDTLSSGIAGACVFIDDAMIGGVDENDHRKNLFEFLKRLSEYGFRLRLCKCSFGQKEIEMLGNHIDAKGIRPIYEKIETIQRIPAPSNVQQLQAFLGAVTWYGKFIDKMKELRGPLDELLCNDVSFEWQPKHQQAFEKIKKVLASDLALTHYDPKKKIIVAADASSYGMGAVLMHELRDGSERPVMHAASSFNSAEKNYPQVQREALALVFALRKFHRYLYGRKFELRTDHKPLLAIFGSHKGIPVYTASRLQRYALVLLAYDFSIKWIDTKSFAYADFISRLIETHEKENEDTVIAVTAAGSMVNGKNMHAPSHFPDKVNEKNENYHAPRMVNVKKKVGKFAPGGESGKTNAKNESMSRNSNDFFSSAIRCKDVDIVMADVRSESETIQCFAIDTAKLMPIQFEDIRKASSSDIVLSKVLELCEKGWPRTQKILSHDVAQFFARRESLMVIENCLFYGDRLVVPTCYQQRVLEELHTGHPGVARMKLLARSKVFWPNIDQQIENLVKKCESCAVNAKSPIKCTLQAWPIPKTPWSRLHVDFAGPVNGFHFFVIVDALSNWPEIFKMTTTTAAKTIDRLEEAFSRHGICDTLVSDNGPQFVSKEFEQFCNLQGIKHIKTAPYHPQSNGRAERFVDLLKTGLKKMSEEGNIDQVLRRFLMCYRYTPSHILGNKSPFQIMTSREMKIRLDQLKKPSSAVQPSRNTLMETQFNSHHGAMWRKFQVGDPVLIKFYSNNKWQWIPGTVTDECGAVNYVVQAETPLGRREIKVHANQMKRSFNVIDSGDNTLLDEFDLVVPNQEIEPEITPEREEEDDEFVDAQEEVPEIVARNQEQPLRRSTRSNAGVMSKHFDDFIMN
jgi:transposase InsO family protein